ncbi:MAG: Methylamine utilization protein MauE [Actinomycetota bacterium]|nr:Methylamine utilization protein MauE [Actinomycetota bacterium]
MTANDIALAARVVVALVLVVSGVGKLLGVRQSIGRYRAQFAGYAWVAVAVALTLPVYELVLAGLLLFVDASWPSYLALATFVAFTIVLVRRVVRNDRRPCNCFGAASRQRTLSIGSLVRNTWFLVLALVATGAATMQEPSAVFATLVVGLGFAAVSAVLVVRT